MANYDGKANMDAGEKFWIMLMIEGFWTTMLN